MNKKTKNKKQNDKNKKKHLIKNKIIYKYE